jgi:NTP pyrophosphatase (non-canonical NTP hydrolase)
LALREAQERVDRWIGQYKEGYFPPLTNLARLAEEVGELAREINHRFGEKTKRRDEPEGSVAMELADILFVVICLANSQQIDLDQAFEAMMRKVTSRDAARWTTKER